MEKFTIIWGHAGTRGREWTSAREASRFAGEEWGKVFARTPADAVTIAEAEGVDVDDWYHDDGVIHVVTGTIEGPE